MDPDLILIGGIFIILTILTGAFALLLPLSRQLARFLEYRMRDKTAPPAALEGEVRELRALVETLAQKLDTVNDRQEFLEKVLESRSSEPLKLPR
jgi:hypothetical protein